jgi:thiol-disulfide isomerase/thioredoxin
VTERAVAASGSSAIPTTFVTRIGLAVVRPQWALAIAGGRRHPGRSGSDLIAMLLLVLLATQLGGLVGAVWLGGAVDFGLGMRAFIQVLTRALTVDLAFLVIGAVLLWLIAGKRRDLGRAFDLACVAALPLLLLELGATTIIRAFDLELPRIAGWALAGMSWAWAGCLIAFAARLARLAPQATPAPAIDGVVLGRKAGWGVMAVVAIGIVINSLWIARNLDLMRPVTHGDPAPAFTLPVIADAKGVLGPARSLADHRGKIVVIDFWATWCKPCLSALPSLEKLAREPDVEVLTINLDDPARAFSMFQTSGYREMALLADDGEVSQRYGVSTIPHTVIVDRDGTVRDVHRGGHDIAAAVQAIK